MKQINIWKEITDNKEVGEFVPRTIPICFVDVKESGSQGVIIRRKLAPIATFRCHRNKFTTPRVCIERKRMKKLKKGFNY